MSDQLQIFENKEFGKVRVLEIDGQPWFVGKDITDVLQYGNSRQALKTNVDDEDKGVHSVDTLGGKQKITIINESGLYALILSSKLPAAKRFKRWVTAVVLPALRRYGAYLTEDTLEAAFGSQEFTLVLLHRLQAEQGKTEALRSRVEVLSPKAQYCDRVLMSGDTIPISIIAKDYGMTAVALNRLLHHLGIQYRLGGVWLLYQRYTGKGYTKSRTYCAPDGAGIVHTCWTQKGRLFLYEFLAAVGIFPADHGAFDAFGCEEGLA